MATIHRYIVQLGHGQFADVWALGDDEAERQALRSFPGFSALVLTNDAVEIGAMQDLLDYSRQEDRKANRFVLICYAVLLGIWLVFG